MSVGLAGLRGTAQTRARLLVVDDDPDLLRLLGMRLRASGYQVVSAENAAQARAHLSIDRFDLVLSDVRISPAARRDFAEKVGRPEVRIDEFGYLGHLVSEGAYRVRTNGLAFACLTVRDRLGRGRKASSK